MVEEQALLTDADSEDAPEWHRELAEQNAPVVFPDVPPQELTNRTLPPIDCREPIAPDADSCPLQTGDMVVTYVGTDAMEWYGYLVLDVYGTRKLIGLALPSYQYVSHALDDYVEWWGQHLGDDNKKVYSHVTAVSREEKSRSFCPPTDRERISDE